MKTIIKAMIFIGLILPLIGSAQDKCPDVDEFLQGELSDLTKVVKKNNEAYARPINIEIVRVDPTKKDHYFSYDKTDLALDAGVASIIWASKDHIPKDKYMHVVAGAVITYGATQLAKVYFEGDDHAELKSILTGVAVTALAGIAKEVWDKQGHGNPEVKDVMYTSLGGALVSIRYTLRF